MSVRRTALRVSEFAPLTFRDTVESGADGGGVKVGGDRLGLVHTDIAPKLAEPLATGSLAIEHREPGGVKMHHPRGDHFGDRRAPNRAKQIGAPGDLVAKRRHRQVYADSLKPFTLTVKRQSVVVLVDHDLRDQAEPEFAARHT